MKKKELKPLVEWGESEKTERRKSRSEDVEHPAKARTVGEREPRGGAFTLSFFNAVKCKRSNFRPRGLDRKTKAFGHKNTFKISKALGHKKTRNFSGAALLAVVAANRLSCTPPTI